MVMLAAGVDGRLDFGLAALWGETHKKGGFFGGRHSEIFHFSWVTLHMRKQPVTTVH